MAELKRCEECGVPEQIAVEREWLNSGVVVQRGNMQQRTGFMEVANLDPLYANMAAILNMPMDRFLLESTRKAVAGYVRGILPEGLQDMLRSGTLKLEALIGVLLVEAETSGYGKCGLLEVHADPASEGGAGFRPGDYVVLQVEDPYSIAPVAGVFTGSCEAVTDLPFVVEYEETSSGVYRVKASVGEHSEETEERLEFKPYIHREGDIVLEPCPTCGVPKALSAFVWHDDRGTIIDTGTGRRMVGVGPYVTDPLFYELEKELGEEMPRGVVEAQRRFIKTGFYSVDEVRDEDAFRARLALRGMGNLRWMKMGPEGISMRIDNAGCYLMTVGTAQAVFEMAYDVDSQVEWELSPEGDLEVRATPR